MSINNNSITIQCFVIVTSPLDVFHPLWHQNWMCKFHCYIITGCICSTGTLQLDVFSTKSHGNLYNSCWDVSVWTKVLDNWRNDTDIHSTNMAELCSAKNPIQCQKHGCENIHKQDDIERALSKRRVKQTDDVNTCTNSKIMKVFFTGRFLKEGWKKLRRQRLQREVKSVTVAVLPRGTLG